MCRAIHRNSSLANRQEWNLAASSRARDTTLHHSYLEGWQSVRGFAFDKSHASSTRTKRYFIHKCTHQHQAPISRTFERGTDFDHGALVKVPRRTFMDDSQVDLFRGYFYVRAYTTVAKSWLRAPPSKPLIG